MSTCIYHDLLFLVFWAMLEHNQCCSVRVSKSATVDALYDRLKLLEGSLDEESFQYHSNIPDRDLRLKNRSRTTFRLHIVKKSSQG